MSAVVSIVGARPQFVKAAVVAAALADDAVEHQLVHTGQHYDDDMSGRFFRELRIPAPALDLGIGSSSHGAQTGRMLEALEQALEGMTAAAVIVYGDTNSTLAGALAAAKLHIPVAHVEAGLRSFNRRMPEEINRIATDHVSDLLLAPTRGAMEQLAREGLQERAHLVGDVMYDAALRYGNELVPELLLAELGIRADYVLATIHRQENTADANRLGALIDALARVGERIQVFLPLHPRTRAALERFDLLDRADAALTLSEPLGYLDMLSLERHARAIVTDSGGVQKEAFFFRVPCVTLREETEWTELVELGWNRLCPVLDAASAAETILGVVEGRPGGVEPPAGLYGAGSAGRRAASLISRLAGHA